MDKGSEVIKIVEWNLKGQGAYFIFRTAERTFPIAEYTFPLRNVRSAVGNINKKLYTCKFKTGLYRNCNRNNPKIQMPLYKRHLIIRVVDINTVIILYYRCEILCFCTVQSTTIFSNTIAGALGVMVMV